MNPLTQVVNDTASGWLTEAWNIMQGPIGYFVYFSLGLAVVGLWVYTVKTWLRK